MRKMRGLNQGITHIKQVLGRVALLVLLLEVHIAQGVNNQDLAILRNDALLGAGRPAALRRRRLGCGRARDRGRATAAASLAPTTRRVLVLLGIALLQPAHLAVHGNRPALLVLILLRRRGGRRSRGLGIDAGHVDAEVLAPGGVARKLDVALDKLALALPAHVQREVVGAAAGNEEDAEHGGTETGPVAVVVVLGALPRGEAVGQEVVVAVAAGPAQDVGDDGEAGLALRGALDGGLDLGRGGLFGHADARLGLLVLGLVLLGLCALGGELLADLVGMELARLLLVRLVDVIVARAAGDAEELVEGDVGALVGDQLIADAEDFAVCRDGAILSAGVRTDR